MISSETLEDRFAYQYYSPEITEEEVKDISQIYYELSLVKIQKLIGYDTLNFLITDYTGEKFIFKVISCTEPPEIAKFLHHQVDLMSKLGEDLPGLIQNVVPPKRTDLGSPVMAVFVKCKKYPHKKHEHNTVLFEYITGETMGKVLPFSLKLLEDLGLKFGMLSVKIQNHGDSFIWSRTNHKWDPKNVLECEPLLDLLQDRLTKERIDICENFFDTYRFKTLPFIEANCRAGLIHSDGNCNNVLVCIDDPDEVKSILDFEDTSSSYIVFECGSLLMYTFAYMPHDDYGQLGAAVMRGFIKHQPLTQPEWSVLYDTVVARLIQSSLYGLYGAILTPENAEYILESQEQGWKVLNRICNMDKNKLLMQWGKNL